MRDKGLPLLPYQCHKLCFSRSASSMNSLGNGVHGSAHKQAQHHCVVHRHPTARQQPLCHAHTQGLPSEQQEPLLQPQIIKREAAGVSRRIGGLMAVTLASLATRPSAAVAECVSIEKDP